VVRPEKDLAVHIIVLVFFSIELFPLPWPNHPSSRIFLKKKIKKNSPLCPLGTAYPLDTQDSTYGLLERNDQNTIG
jgi:hypothetical protein